MSFGSEIDAKLTHEKLQALRPFTEVITPAEVFNFTGQAKVIPPSPHSDYAWIMLIGIYSSIAMIGAAWLLIRKKKYANPWGRPH